MVDTRLGALLATALAAVVLTACHSGGGGAHSTAPTGLATDVTVAASDRAACAQLYARLQRVTLALQTSSELITNSANQRQLSTQVALEQDQLTKSAQLMDQGAVPAALAPANRQLVAALRTFSADFARAKQPAERGDYGAAVTAMTDRATVQRIIAASTAIENACA